MNTFGHQHKSKDQPREALKRLPTRPQHWQMLVRHTRPSQLPFAQHRRSGRLVSASWVWLQLVLATPVDRTASLADSRCRQLSRGGFDAQGANQHGRSGRLVAAS